MGDFALIKAYKADTKGNLIFNLTARNFAVPMAKAGKICIAEVEEIVPEGTLGPGTPTGFERTIKIVVEWDF